MSAYTRRKGNLKYKNRIRMERASQQQSNGTNKTPYDRVKQRRQRKIMNAADRINDGAGTSAAGTAGYSRTTNGRVHNTATPDFFL